VALILITAAKQATNSITFPALIRTYFIFLGVPLKPSKSFNNKEVSKHVSVVQKLTVINMSGAYIFLQTVAF